MSNKKRVGYYTRHALSSGIEARDFVLRDGSWRRADCFGWAPSVGVDFVLV